MFGLFTLTWLVSGLFSANPWGALEGRSFADEAERLGGLNLDFASVREAVRSLGGTEAPTGAVRLEGFAAGGELSFIATDGEGRRRRLDHETLADEPLRESYFEIAAATLRPDAAVRDAGWIGTGDAYYYTHHEARPFPVYRIRYEDGERVYLDRSAVNWFSPWTANAAGCAGCSMACTAATYMPWCAPGRCGS